MQVIDMVLLVSRWFHIAAAIVAIGGAVFTRVVLLPAARDTLREEDHEKLRAAVTRRWRWMVHGCILLLLATGIFNFFYLVLPSKVNPMPYHAVFGVKVLAALVVFGIASALVSRGTGIRRARPTWLTVLMILAGVIVLLSGALGQIRSKSGLPGPARSVSVDVLP